jgi:hypothetical protein
LSTLRKVLLGAVVVAVLCGGAAWAAVEASNSQSSATAPAMGPRRPGRFVPGGGSGLGSGPRAGAGRLGPSRPLEGGRFLCAVAHAELVLVEGDATHQVRLDRGTVASVSARSLTIAEADGSTVTIQVDQDTKIRRDGREASLSELGQSDSVFAVQEGTGPARSLRAFDPRVEPCDRRLPGSFPAFPSPSPSSG